MHVLAVVLAVLSGLYAAAMILSALVFGGLFVLVTALLDDRAPKAVREGVWVVVAVLVGALIGADTYSVGVPGLLSGPILIALVPMALRATPSLSRRGRRLLAALGALAGVTALGVGLTILT